MAVHQIEFSISLPFRIKKEGKYYISNCPVLDVWSQGGSEKRAIENLIEALQLFLVDCYERGVLDRALKECGFKAAPKRRKAPRPESTVTVPLPFIIDKQRAQCHG